jgi:hypothetical protein
MIVICKKAFQPSFDPTMAAQQTSEESQASNQVKAIQ